MRSLSIVFKITEAIVADSSRKRSTVVRILNSSVSTGSLGNCVPDKFCQCWVASVTLDEPEIGDEVVGVLRGFDEALFVFFGVGISGSGFSEVDEFPMFFEIFPGVLPGFRKSLGKDLRMVALDVEVVEGVRVPDFNGLIELDAHVTVWKAVCVKFVGDSTAFDRFERKTGEAVV